MIDHQGCIGSRTQRSDHSVKERQPPCALVEISSQFAFGAGERVRAFVAIEGAPGEQNFMQQIGRQFRNRQFHPSLRLSKSCLSS